MGSRRIALFLTHIAPENNHESVVHALAQKFGETYEGSEQDALKNLDEFLVRISDAIFGMREFLHQFDPEQNENELMISVAELLEEVYDTSRRGLPLSGPQMAAVNQAMGILRGSGSDSDTPAMGSDEMPVMGQDGMGPVGEGAEVPSEVEAIGRMISKMLGFEVVPVKVGTIPVGDPA